MHSLTYLTGIGLALWVVAAAPPNVAAEDYPVGEPLPMVSGMSNDELDAQRGGEVVTISDATLTATLEDNTLTGGSITGTNSVGGSAFTGATGFMSVIQNSGNQVIIQDSTIINVTVE